MLLLERGQQIHPSTEAPSMSSDSERTDEEYWEAAHSDVGTEGRCDEADGGEALVSHHPLGVKSHGLFNQGATCYLNSVLQVLSMTENFRGAVERHTCENPDTDCIDTQLADLFKNLREKTANTCNITKKLGIDRVNEQCDAAEYFERILSLSSPTASEIFHGQLTHKTTCSTCRKETCSDGGFWHLPIALVDSSRETISVVNGIEDFFQTTDFSRENQVYCEQCDTKSDATSKCEIRHHPEALMLLLKRFKFDYHCMTYVKNYCTVDVPYTIQIPENQTYQLFAVVDHFGELRSGHYTAQIKVDGIWCNFNDDMVSQLDYPPFQVDTFERSYSAYLLFYRKMNARAADDAHTEDIFLHVSCNMRDQSQDAVKMWEEGERVVEASRNTVVTVNTDENEETGIKDSVESKGIGLAPDTPCISEDQEHYEVLYYYLKKPRAEQQRDDGKLVAGRTTKVGVPELELKDKKFQYIQSPHEKQNAMSAIKTVECAGNGDQGKSLIHCPHSDAESQDNEDDGRQGMNENMNSAQGAFSVDERMEVKVKVGKDGKIGVDERGSGPKGRKLLTKYDLCFPEIQDDGGVGDLKNDMPKDHQRFIQGGRTIHERFEQQVEAKRDVQEQNRGDDKHVQRSNASITEPYLSSGTEDADERGMELKGRKHLIKDDLGFLEKPDHPRLDHSKQSMLKEDPRSKQGGSSSHTRHEQKVEVKTEVQRVKRQKRQTKEEETREDEHIPNRAESSCRRAASTGLTDDSPVAGLELSKDAGEHCSEKSKICEKPGSSLGGSQRSGDIKSKEIGGFSQQGTLTKFFSNLKLSKSSLPENRRAKRPHPENEADSVILSNATKMQNVSAQKPPATMKQILLGKRSKLKRLKRLPRRHRRRENYKKFKTAGCFSFMKCQK